MQDYVVFEFGRRRVIEHIQSAYLPRQCIGEYIEHMTGNGLLDMPLRLQRFIFNHLGVARYKRLILEVWYVENEDEHFRDCCQSGTCIPE